MCNKILVMQVLLFYVRHCITERSKIMLRISTFESILPIDSKHSLKEFFFNIMALLF